MMTNNENKKAVKPIEIQNESPLEKVVGGRGLLSSDECRFFVTDECVKCGDCAASCPFDAIRFTTHAAFIDPRICGNCGTCAAICPIGAICER